MTVPAGWATRAWRGLRWLLLTEWRMYVGATRLLLRRPDVPEGATPHRHAGAVSALLWGFVAVSAVEVVALHLILPWPAVRLAADVVGIWGVFWCLGLTGCHYVYPHLSTDDGLHLRSVRHHDVVFVPWTSMAGAHVRERSIEGREIQVAPGGGGPALLVGVGKRTNVEITLATPVRVEIDGVTHEVHEVRGYADDARSLVATLRPHRDGGAAHPS